jgi:SAM-dependent methyltransferase
MSDRQPNPQSFPLMRETTARYYSDKVRQFGATARGVDWNSEESQTRRFEELLRLTDQRDDPSVNDYGCGYGALVDHLRRQRRPWRYTGFDISEPMIAHAVAAHASDPLCSFTTEADALQPADYTFASGVFNVKQDYPADTWQDYVLATLAAIDRLSRRGFAFNMLSSYCDADRQRADLFYGRPAFFFDFCKTHFSPRVALLHDYPLYEFTILVRK